MPPWFGREAIQEALSQGIAGGFISYDGIRQILLNRTLAHPENSGVSVPEKMQIPISVGDPGRYNELLEVSA